MKGFYSDWRTAQNAAAGVLFVLCIVFFGYWYVWLPLVIIALIVRAVINNRQYRVQPPVYGYGAQAPCTHLPQAEPPRDLALDSVLKWHQLDEQTEMAIVGYEYSPDLKAQIRIVTNAGMSDKVWKRSVRTKYVTDKKTQKQVAQHYIMLNGKEYRVAL